MIDQKIFNESLKLPDNTSIYFTRYAEKLPVSEIRVTSGEGVCKSN